MEASLMNKMGIAEIDHSRPGHLVAGPEATHLRSLSWNPRGTVLISTGLLS